MDRKLFRKIFSLIALCIVFGWILLDTNRALTVFASIWGLISPFVVGAAIAFVFNVPMRWVEGILPKRVKPPLRRGLAIILTLLGIVLVVIVVFDLMIPQIRQTVVSLSERIPPFLEKANVWVGELRQQHPDFSKWVMESLNLEGMDWAGFLKDSASFLGGHMANVMGGAVNVIGSVGGAVVSAVISLVFAIYCLAGKETLASQARRLLYSLVTEPRADYILRVAQLTNHTFSKFISGQVLEACILGLLFVVPMAIFRMPYILLISIIIAVTALIPVVGAFVGCFVGAFFILVNNPIQAITFIIMFLVIQQLENNLIYPRVVGTSVGLPGMWVLVAVTIGGNTLGVAGMLVMIPLASVCYALIREFTNKRLAERSIPPEKLQSKT